MPIFEYRCQACGEQFEELVFGSRTEVVCPACGAADVKKLVSVVSFRTGGTSESSGGYRRSSGSACAGCSATSCSTCH